MNTYCGGDKGAMKSMIECIQKGEEEDEELLERFGKMRAYLEKRDEQAGDWVFEVSLVSVYYLLPLPFPSFTTFSTPSPCSSIPATFILLSYMLDLSAKGKLTISWQN